MLLFKMESLFSLEIHVESVEALQVICRLPAVSFRLLNFPTLIIHHVSPIMAEKIRHKVAMEAAGANESLKELKDRRGNFQFQKGKSCLFKANIDVLHTQLQTTPFYVMLLDLWPKKPKLVGSGGIQMKTAINAMHQQIRAQGVAVPSFYKESGDFDLFNLMGSTVARVKLGYRLVSLGGSLIPHVPTTTGYRREKSQVLTETIEEDVLEESNMLIREPVPAEMESKKLDFLDTKQMSRHQHAHTQTTLVGTSKANKRPPVQIREEEDVIITNTVCPPPLYFNALSEPQTKSNITETHTEDRESVAHNTDTGYAEDDHAFALSAEKVDCMSVSVQTDPTGIMAQQTATGPQSEAVLHQPTLQSLFTVMETSSRYPILNALFQELSSFTTRQHKDESGSEGTTREVGPSKDKEGTQRLTTNPQTSQKGSTTTKKTTAVPKKSSVIGLPRQRVRFRQTSLTYKMTRTQQMRLEQNLRGHVDRVRLCASANQHPEQCGMAKETPARDLGRTYRKEQGQVETTVMTAEKQGANGAKEKAMSKSWKGAGNEVHSAEIQSTAQSTTSPAGSRVGSAMSYKSQNSLEIFLPTADGETDSSSCTEEAPHPIPNLDALPSGTQLLSTVTSVCEDFEDTTLWHDYKTEDSAHRSLESSESHLSDNASEQLHGEEKSGHFRPPISKSPQKISRSRRAKSADSLIQKVSLCDAYPRETRSSSDLLNSEEISQQLDKQSLSSSGSTVKEKESVNNDESYSDDFLSGSEAERSESQ